MGISNSIKNATGIITVQIEGFFTERFINLCKINNIKIWDIRPIVQGIIRLKIYISDFKKLRPIAKKTKCKVKIKQKQGLYFKFLKYKKRRLLLYIISILVLFIVIFSSFIWQINIVGNDKISKEEILVQLKTSGAFVGKCKIGLSKKEIINSFRANMPDIAWAGITISGTKLELEVVEKVVVDESQRAANTVPGDIFANKTGIITKIVAENGTAKYKEGSYVEPGFKLIEGVIISKVLQPEYVHAKGIVRINSEYVYEKEYKYEELKKEYTGSKKYTIGISINNKENMLNYLNKKKKYDITKSGKELNLFGLKISFDLYKCNEYVEKNMISTKEQLIEQANTDAKKYIEQIMPTLKSAYFANESETVQDTNTGIIYKKIYTVNEQIGEFKERGT